MATVREKRSIVPWYTARRRSGKPACADSANPGGRRLPFAQRYLLQVWLTSLPLWLADQLALAISLAAAVALQSILPGPGHVDVVITWAALAVGGCIVNYCFGLYPGIGLNSEAELRKTSLALTVLFGAFAAAMLTRDVAAGGARLLAEVWLLALAATPMLRRAARQIAAGYSWWGQPALVLGGHAAGAHAYRALLASPQQGLRPVGILDDLHRHWADEFVDPAWYLGPLDATDAIAREHNVFWGVVSLNPQGDVAQLMDRYTCALPHLLLVPNVGNPPRLWEGAHDCGRLGGMRLDERILLPMPQLAKRTLDLLLTLVGGLFILPLVAAIALAIRIDSPGPIFYSQDRVGRGGRRFRAWKFRSMVVNAEQALDAYLEQHPEMKEEWVDYQKLKRDPRVTAVGKFLRKSSLDELPQLWNVLNGDMSLVGPRPILFSQIQDYKPFHLYVRLRPGITGLWQISGRNFTTFQQRAEYDTIYARNWSLWFDLHILMRTLKVVLRCEGSY